MVPRNSIILVLHIFPRCAKKKRFRDTFSHTRLEVFSSELIVGSKPFHQSDKTFVLLLLLLLLLLLMLLPMPPLLMLTLDGSDATC